MFTVLALLSEKLVPYDVLFNKPQSDVKGDVIHAFVNESMSILGILSIPIIASVMFFPSFWPTTLPLWLQVLFAVLIADVGITLAHYTSHKFRLLWRFHAVHHSIKRLYGFNGLMKHPLHQAFETFVGTTPLLLLGIPQDVLMLLVVAVVLQLLLQHSNVAYFTGPFKYLWSVNAIHRFHHLNTAKEGDVNFGLFTTMVDHLLGTFYYDNKRKISVSDLGISSQPKYPKTYWQQLLAPFKQKNPMVRENTQGS